MIAELQFALLYVRFNRYDALAVLEIRARAVNFCNVCMYGVLALFYFWYIFYSIYDFELVLLIRYFELPKNLLSIRGDTRNYWIWIKYTLNWISVTYQYWCLLKRILSHIGEFTCCFIGYVLGIRFKFQNRILLSFIYK